jgi:DNA-directed RNA polymerase I subunit RPA12
MLDQDYQCEDFNNIFYRPPNFCADCGDMLDFEIIENDMVLCQKCGGEVSVESITNHKIETVSYYHNSKDWMNKLANIEDKFKVKQSLQRQTVQEKCPECPSKKMYFYAIQTRSADEGSTVFYSCVKCGFVKKENN